MQINAHLVLNELSMIMTCLFTNAFSSVHMDKKNRLCWATEVNNLLFRNVSGYAWTHQEEGNELESQKSYVQQISDVYIYRQKWFSDIDESKVTHILPV